jgi:hypothetical protein
MWTDLLSPTVECDRHSLVGKEIIVNLSIRPPIVAALVAATAILLAAATVLAVDFGPSRILRIAPEDTSLLVHDISADGDSMAVVWTEESAGASQAFIRWSHDGGQTFEEQQGWNAMEPRLDTCKNGPTFAILAYLTATGRGLGVEIEYGDEFIGTGIRWTRRGAIARHPDIACVGESTAPAYTLAAAWLDESTSPAHVKVRVRVFRDYFCHDCGVPGRFDPRPRAGPREPRAEHRGNGASHLRRMGARPGPAVPALLRHRQ